MKPAEGTRPSSPGVAFQGAYHTSITLHVDPAKSTGIFAGSTGEIAVHAPAHKESGYLVVNTEKGDLTMTFLEWPEGTKLIVELRVDGSKSTGVYRNSRGTLKFEMDRIAIGVAAGSYSGVLDLTSQPST